MLSFPSSRMTEQPSPKRPKQAPDYYEILNEQLASDPTVKRISFGEVRFLIAKALQQVKDTPEKTQKVRERANELEREFLQRKLNRTAKFFERNPDGAISSTLSLPMIDAAFEEAKARGALVDDLEAQWKELRSKIEAAPQYRTSTPVKPDLDDDTQGEDQFGFPFENTYEYTDDDDDVF